MGPIVDRWECQVSGPLPNKALGHNCYALGGVNPVAYVALERTIGIQQIPNHGSTYSSFSTTALDERLPPIDSLAAVSPNNTEAQEPSALQASCAATDPASEGSHNK